MSEKYTATGTIQRISPEQTRGTFTFQTFALTIPDEKYPQTVEFQLAARNFDALAEVSEGQAVTVSFNLRGREWTKPDSGEVKVFNTLDCWRIEPVAGASTAPEQAPPLDEDLPF